MQDSLRQRVLDKMNPYQMSVHHVMNPNPNPVANQPIIIDDGNPELNRHYQDRLTEFDKSPNSFYDRIDRRLRRLDKSGKDTAEALKNLQARFDEQDASVQAHMQWTRDFESVVDFKRTARGVEDQINEVKGTLKEHAGRVTRLEAAGFETILNTRHDELAKQITTFRELCFSLNQRMMSIESATKNDEIERRLSQLETVNSRQEHSNAANRIAVLEGEVRMLRQSISASDASLAKVTAGLQGTNVRLSDVHKTQMSQHGIVSECLQRAAKIPQDDDVQVNMSDRVDKLQQSVDQLKEVNSEEVGNVKEQLGQLRADFDNLKEANSRLTLPQRIQNIQGKLQTEVQSVDERKEARNLLLQLYYDVSNTLPPEEGVLEPEQENQLQPVLRYPTVAPGLDEQQDSTTSSQRRSPTMETEDDEEDIEVIQPPRKRGKMSARRATPYSMTRRSRRAPKPNTSADFVMWKDVRGIRDTLDRED